jgi:hypothetical protein
MSLLTALFRSRSTVTKIEIVSMAAARFDQVLMEEGLEALLSGRLVLDRQLRVSFRSSGSASDRDTLAEVAVDELEDVGVFRMLARAGTLTSDLYRIFVDRLAYASWQQLEARCPAFARLPMDWAL